MNNPPSINLRPLADRDAAELRRIRADPDVSRWWDACEPGFPWEEPGSTRLAIEFAGQLVGMIQYAEVTEPQYRSAGIDLFIDPEFHGRGIGTESVRQVARLLFAARGHHRITIDPATENTAAIRCYSRAGFRKVGVMRQAERDPDGQGWHDCLLMELLAEDLSPGSSS